MREKTMTDDSLAPEEEIRNRLEWVAKALQNADLHPAAHGHAIRYEIDIRVLFTEIDALRKWLRQKGTALDEWIAAYHHNTAESDRLTAALRDAKPALLRAMHSDSLSNSDAIALRALAEMERKDES